MESNELQLLPWKDWKSFFGHQHPIVISGPCGAETESQVLATAKDLKQLGIGVFRAGVWKPRTRPGDFEGMGEEALKWLQQVKKKFDMKVATEVATGKHVQLALAHGIDILWIGARTSANPFAVQDIADTLHTLGTDLPILIKNPINPDLGLWIGAIERIARAGISRIGCIHRGFSFYGNTSFRNPPYWQIPIELKRRLPELPIFCDPSHICGNREKLFKISQIAMNLNFDGLMIESHITPDDAWSDAFQQITPHQLHALLKNLHIRQLSTESQKHLQALYELREMIDTIDHEILGLLAQRVQVSEKIGQYKKEHDITVLQPKRWTKILDTAVKEGLNLGLNQNFIEKLFETIHIESIQIQNKLMNK